MNKQQMTETILEAKKEKGISWDTLSEKTNLNPVCITAACLGSASLMKPKQQLLYQY